MNATRIAVDPAGNSYSTGTFSGSALFGASTFSSVGGTDFYLTKTDPAGEVVWTQVAGGAGSDFSRSVAVDGDGNAYVAGSFQGDATFGSETVSGGFGQNAFLAKYNSAGALQWVRTGGGADAEALSVALDADGNPRITGFFTGTAAFGALSLTSAGASDVFVVAYDASGAEQWATRAGGSAFGYQAEGGRGLAVDSNGDVYVAGNFVGWADFGPSTINSAGGQDIFVAKYSPAAGDWQWVRRGGGSSADFASELRLDGAGNVYVAGLFSGSSVFGGTTLTAGFGSSFDQNYFLLKYDAAGALQWANQVDGVGYFAGHGLAVDVDGNAYFAATFDGTATVGGTNITSAGYDNIYVAKFNSDGANEWAVHSAGAMYHVASGIALDQYGNLYMAGWFMGSATFDGAVLESASTDAFVAMMGHQREPEVELVAVRLDIRPGSCINPLQTKSRGVLPAAILGAEDVDLAAIDLDTVTLWRADGVGGSVSPVRFGFDSVGECNDAAADDLPDLTMKFDTAELVEVLELAGLPRGTEVELVVSGALGDGAEFGGIDTVLVR